MQQPIVVVNIISLSYSGSTWLNLMLGSHSSAFSVGEMKRILHEGGANCALHGETCPMWSQFSMDSGENPFVQLARITGKRLFIVNNSRKFLKAQRHPGVVSRFVHLVRDLRAVLASAKRKKPEKPTWRWSKEIARDVRRDRRLLRRQPDTDSILTYYERLQVDTTAELQRLCDFLDVPYEPAMQEFWQTEHHFIGGNRGTLFSMLRQQEPKAAPEDVMVQTKTDLNWDIGYYKKQDPLNFVDERWKSELSDAQLRTFAFWAGRLNKRLGYPRATDRGPIDLERLEG